MNEQKKDKSNRKYQFKIDIRRLRDYDKEDNVDLDTLRKRIKIMKNRLLGITPKDADEFGEPENNKEVQNDE